LVLVPALAVDPRGHRIGYGKGYYDWLLGRVVPPAFALAVAFDFQLVSEIPVAEHDRAVNLVVTDRRTFRAQS
jgi:5-formyltetrahydrofolate cyclo-ligase